MKLKKLYLDRKEMKIVIKILIIGIFFIGYGESKANTLFESLQSAYLNNSKLNAERANMRASREEKREAVSEFLPSVTISGYKSQQDNFNSNADDLGIDPKERSAVSYTHLTLPTNREV